MYGIIFESHDRLLCNGLNLLKGISLCGGWDCIMEHIHVSIQSVLIMHTVYIHYMYMW